MNKIEVQNNWSALLKTFSRQHEARPTRIGVFEGEPGAMADYWLEDGLPLEGIDIDAHGDKSPTIEIMLGNVQNPGSRVFTHTITKTRFIKMILSASGESDGLEIEDESGAITILRFEN